MITLTPATTKDIPLIRRLAREIWTAVYPAIISEAQIDYMLDKIYSIEQLEGDLQNEVLYYLLTLDSATVGYAALGPAEAQNELPLHKLYLHPSHHGKGLGSSALRAIVGEANHLGAEKITLRANRNNTPAIRCYERNGFSIQSKLCSDIGNGFVMDDYVMVRTLAPLPPPLREIVEFFEPLGEQERRDALASYATAVENYAPKQEETYQVTIERHDSFCLDKVSVHLMQTEGKMGVVRFRLGPQVQTLTRALAVILSKGFDHQPIDQIAGICDDFIPRIVGSKLMRLRSRTVYYLLDRIREAISELQASSPQLPSRQ